MGGGRYNAASGLISRDIATNLIILYLKSNRFGGWLGREVKRCIEKLAEQKSPVLVSRIHLFVKIVHTLKQSFT